MIKEARLIVPNLDNSGNSTEAVLDWTGRQLARQFGGFTMLAGHGCWIDGRRVYKDAITIFDIAMDDTEANHKEMRRIAEHVCVEAKQEAVYLRLASGTVSFIEVSEREAA